MCGSFQHPAPGGTHQTFGIENVKDAAIEQIKLGLHEEGSAKEYIDSTDLTDENINGFLRKVFFVIDDGKKPSEYVKAIIRQHPNIIPEEKILNAIFNEIRDKQASKKNISSVEGIVIETTDEALNYCRHLTNNEIRLMTLQRIINRDPLGQGIPPSFVSIYNTWPPERQREMLEDCQGALCRALFNKNAADGFWYLFENVSYQTSLLLPPAYEYGYDLLLFHNALFLSSEYSIARYAYPQDY